jgi:hypothetical protein
MNPKDSLSCSQRPTNDSNPDPHDISSRHPHLGLSSFMIPYSTFKHIPFPSHTSYISCSLHPLRCDHLQEVIVKLLIMQLAPDTITLVRSIK